MNGWDKIEAALEDANRLFNPLVIFHPEEKSYCRKKIVDALSALASLRQGGEGDVAIIQVCLDDLFETKGDEGFLSEDGRKYRDKVLGAFSRLVAKAKLAEGERVRIKRETLEELKQNLDGPPFEYNSVAETAVIRLVNWQIDRQLAELEKNPEAAGRKEE